MSNIFCSKMDRALYFKAIVLPILNYHDHIIITETLASTILRSSFVLTECSVNYSVKKGRKRVFTVSKQIYPFSCWTKLSLRSREVSKNMMEQKKSRWYIFLPRKNIRIFFSLCLKVSKDMLGKWSFVNASKEIQI